MKELNKKQESQKTIVRKIWNFLWKEDSIWSWLFSIILAFVIVKFIFFPLLSLILATPLPLVVVESGSMQHGGIFIGNVLASQENFDLWWNEKGSWYSEKGIEKEEAEKWAMRTGLDVGDIILVSGYGKPKVGDIIIFEAGQKHPIIHRVVEIKNISGKIYYSTKGDNNDGQLIAETEISENSVLGKAVFRIPKLGWLKLAFVKLFESFLR